VGSNPIARSKFLFGIQSSVRLHAAARSLNPGWPHGNPRGGEERLSFLEDLVRDHPVILPIALMIVGPLLAPAARRVGRGIGGITRKRHGDV
jgi:hypothetical protein